MRASIARAAIIGWLVLLLVAVPFVGACVKTAPGPTPAPKPATTPTPALAPALAPAPAPKPAPILAPIKWKAQAGMAATSWSYMYQYQKFVDLVNERSGGRLKIELFAPGAIVDAYEQFGAVQKKAIEVGMGVGGYNIKHVPEADIEQGLPGTFRDINEALDFISYYKDGAAYKILKEAYREKGAYLLNSFGYSPLVLISKKPLNSAAAIRGLKIRGSGANVDLIKNLGGSPVTLAPAEVFMALQTGTIDGVIFPSYTIGTMKLWDAAKGILGPSFGQTAGDIYVNLEVWNSLPNDLKWMVEASAIEANIFYQYTITREIGAILKEAESKHGVTIVNLPPAEYAKVLEASVPILDGAAKKSPKCAELIKLMKEYLAQ